MAKLFHAGPDGLMYQPPAALPPPAYEAHRDPRGYVAGEGLISAVNVAVLLGQPLLVTGEPGTGKTQLAAAVASALHRSDPQRYPHAEPLECLVQSTTTARELIYQFDELARFRDSREGGRRSLRTYLSFNGLGKAILFAGGRDAALELLPGHAFDEAEGRPQRFADLYPGKFAAPEGCRTVVLVDELDKAPRDTPNDMLNWIERMAFEIPELGVRVALPPDRPRPFVIITSNSEKSLPEPFLRRCAYYDIPFPQGRQLLRIIYGRVLELKGEGRAVLLKQALDLFDLLRERGRGIRKPPGTAELLVWLFFLVQHDLTRGSQLKDHPDLVRRSLSALIKSRDDTRAAEQVLDRWLAEQ